MDINQLRELIAHLDDLYYNHATSEVSDIEYDLLRQRLEELEGPQQDLPGAPTGLFEKYKHTEPVTSLGKVNTEEKLRAELEKLMPVVIMPKFDGLTVVKYPTGAAVTRGNGEVGDDIRENFTNFDYTYPLPVRGEAIIKRDDFEALNALRKKEGAEPFKNRRNAVAGILRSKDNKYKDFVSYRVFEVIGTTISLTDALELIESGTKYDVTDYWTFDDVDKAADFILNFDRDSYMFELDGLVIKTNQEDSLEKFGRTSHHPKDAFAYKFPVQGEWTKLTNVHWTVGRTGKVVPNAIYEPVKILDTTVQNATLHNIAYIDALRLSIGCDIKVVKANDIIPAIVESRNYNPLNKIVEPKQCPQCDQVLEKVADQLFCRNESCSSRLLTHLVHLAGKDAFDIQGLSEQTIQKLIDAGHIQDVTDLFNLTILQLEGLPGFAEKSAAKIFNAIKRSKDIDFNRLIVAANIPTVGRTASKELAKVYKNYMELVADRDNNFAKAKEIEGFGPIMANNLKNHLGSIIKLASSMDAIPNPLYGSEKKGDYIICVTGTLSQPRNYYQQLIEDAGHTFASSVTKKVTHLVAGQAAGSKATKAESLNIPILDEQGLYDLLGE